MRYWLKEIVSRPLFLPNGAKVPFEPVGGDYGLLASEDEYVTKELDKAIAMHVGGVVPLTEEEYKSWSEKKRISESSSNSSLPKDREVLGPIPFQQLQAIRAAGAAAAVNPPGPPVVAGPGQAQRQANQQRVEPISTPSQFSKPKVGRIPKGPPTPLPSAPLPPPSSVAAPVP